MKNLKTIILTGALLALLSSSAWAWGVLGMSGTQATKANGMIGTKNHTFGDTAYKSCQPFFSEFVTTTAGTVTYVFFDNNSSSLNSTITKFAIWSSDGTLLASSSNCSLTQVSGTLYRATLSSPIDLSASTTYRLGIVTGDNDWSLSVCGTSGSVWHDNTTVTFSQCPGSIENGVTKDGTDNGSYTMCIWASNNADDTY